MKESLEVLLAILATGQERVKAADFGSSASLAPLRSAGFLVECGTVHSILCTACERQHLASVTSHPISGKPAYRCPEAGWIIPSYDDLRLLKVSIPALVALIGTGLDVERTRQNPALGAGLWRIGVTGVGDLDVEILLLTVRQIGAREVATLAGRRGHDVGIMLTADDGADIDPEVCRYTPLCLGRILDVQDDGTFRVRRDRFAKAVRASLPEPAAVKSGRPGSIERTRHVMDALARDGMLPTGRNATAEAVADAWEAVFPGDAAPAESTLRRHVTELRETQRLA